MDSYSSLTELLYNIDRSFQKIQLHKEIPMKKLVIVVFTAMLVLGFAGATFAQQRYDVRRDHHYEGHRGRHHGGGIAGGIVAGAIIGTFLASPPPPAVCYRTVYGYDQLGRLVRIVEPCSCY